MKSIAICVVAFCLGCCSQANGQTGIITTVAGNGKPAAGGGDGGPATLAALSAVGLGVDGSGNLFIAGGTLVRKVSASGIITTVAGGGNPIDDLGDNLPATSASLSGVYDVAVDASGNMFIADGFHSRVRKVSANGIIITVAGNGFNAPILAGGNGGFSGDGGPAISARLSIPEGITIDPSGNLFIADLDNQRIRKVSANGIITTVAGNSPVCIIVAIPAYCGSYAGDGGPATSAMLNNPADVAVDASGDLFVADTDNNRIRKVSASGIITTVAGNGIGGFSGDGGPATSAQLNNPFGIAVDASGNLLIADSSNNRIRKVSANGIITTIVGNGIRGFSGDGGLATSAQLSGPARLAVDAAGNLFIADSGNLRVRKVSAPLAAAGPSIAPAGVVPVGSTVNTIQPGEWVSIYGTNLSSSTMIWNGDFPTSLGGTSVTINGKAAYLSFVSSTQINLQAPNDTATGPVAVVVTRASGTAASTVTLAPFAPSFLLLDSKHVAGIILRSNGSGAYGGGTYDIVGPNGTSLGYATVAAKAGDIIELFGTGFGPTSPAVPAGQTFSGTAPTIDPANVLINNVSVTPSFAGLSGAGLYQINLTVPAGLGTGDVLLVATVGGVRTPPTVVISLQ